MANPPDFNANPPNVNDLMITGTMLARVKCDKHNLGFTLFEFPPTVFFDKATYWICIFVADPVRVYKREVGVFKRMARRVNGGPEIA